MVIATVVARKFESFGNGAASNSQKFRNFEPFSKPIWLRKSKKFMLCFAAVIHF